MTVMINGVVLLFLFLSTVCSSKAPQQWMIKHFTVVFQDMYRENTSGWPVEVSWSPITGKALYHISCNVSRVRISVPFLAQNRF